MDDWTKFKGNEYDDDGELLLGMKEINQRRKDLKVTEDEWVAIWMLGIVKKRKKLDKFAYQALQDVIKLGRDNVVQNFEEKFKELRVEGNRRENGSSTSVMFTEEDKYFDDDEEMEEADYEDDL